MNMQAIVSVFLSGIRKASGHPVKWSIMVRVCWFPYRETFRSVITSMAALSNGWSGISIICNGYICNFAFSSCMGGICDTFADVLIHSLAVVLSFNKMVSGEFTLMVSCSVASTDVLVLLQVWVAGPSTGEAVTELTRMLVAAALFLGTSTSPDRQSAALLWALDIHSKVILYVAYSNDHQFTLLLVFFPLRNFCKGLWSFCMMMSDPWW